MTSLDFMMACIGSGVFLVCVAWSIKIISDTRARARVARSHDTGPLRPDEPQDPLGRQLQEFRSTRFGREMTQPRPPRPAETWPVMHPRVHHPVAPDDKRKRDKGQGEK